MVFSERRKFIFGTLRAEKPLVQPAKLVVPTVVHGFVIGSRSFVSWVLFHQNFNPLEVEWFTSWCLEGSDERSWRYLCGHVSHLTR